MTSLPEVSVVVPTCGRPGPLRRLLTALARQADAPRVEVVIVADGVDEGRLGVDAGLPLPFALRVLSQPPLGPAAARNRGAQAARAPLLLFIDDDVEPSPGVLRAHVRYHETRARAVGAGDLAPHPLDPGFIGQAIAGWWERMCDDLYDPRHRFTFRDFLTGHCSLSLALFREVGGFDEALRCHEDFEFGYRAIQAGVSFGFVQGARAVHHDATRLPGILARKLEEGRADIQLTGRHPALLRALPLGRPLAPGELARRVFDAALAHGGMGDAGVRALPGLMRLFEAGGMRDKWRTTLERAMDFAYWRGAVLEAGSGAAVRALRARPDHETAAPLVVDLQWGLEEVEAAIDRERPAALRITVGAHLVGDLPEQPGAEALRGVHLRPLLLKHLAGGLARAASAAGILPVVFDGLVPGSSSEAGGTGCAVPALPTAHVG